MGSKLGHLLPLLAVAAAVGWAFDALNVPVGWLLGPMAVGLAASALNGKPQPLPSGFQIVGQAVIGVSTGVSFPLATLLRIGTHAVPLTLAVLFTGGLSLLNGYLLWRWAGVERATGFIGSLPGAASSMVAMSDEMGADAVVVAILQYLRLLMVVFLTPPAVGWLFPSSASHVAGAAHAGGLPAAPVLLNLAVLAAAGAVGAWGGRRIHLPSPTFLGPFLVALALSWTLPYQFHLPQVVFAAGMIAVGVSIGSRFDVATARKLGRVALVEALLVLALIGVCLAVGVLFHLTTGIDTMTAVLGSTPGGMDVMVASAVQLGGDSGLVLAMQMTRWLIVLLAGPWVTVRLIGGKRNA